jgi:hypothetical protein
MLIKDSYEKNKQKYKLEITLFCNLKVFIKQNNLNGGSAQGFDNF